MAAHTLSRALFQSLPIPLFIRRNLYVERALQERRAAATALECLQANLMCLKLEVEDLEAGDSGARRRLATMRALIRDMERNLAYDEVELEHASAEI